MASAVRVHGLRELNQAFGKLSADLKRDLRVALQAAGLPVARRAEELAATNIRNIGARWSRMRVGATQSLVYVAPKARRLRGSPRPNLAPLLMDKAMQPALDDKEPEIVSAVDQLLGRLAGEAGF